MSAGSVIVDLAAESGGNCEISVIGEVVVDSGISIYAERNVASQMPVHASVLYARNILEFVSLLAAEGNMRPISTTRSSRGPASSVAVRSSTPDGRAHRRVAI